VNDSIHRNGFSSERPSSLARELGLGVAAVDDGADLAGLGALTAADAEGTGAGSGGISTTSARGPLVVCNAVGAGARSEPAAAGSDSTGTSLCPKISQAPVPAAAMPTPMAIQMPSFDFDSGAARVVPKAPSV
jgi:hypothetical protein